MKIIFVQFVYFEESIVLKNELVTQSNSTRTDYFGTALCLDLFSGL